MIDFSQALRRVCSHLDDVRGIALMGMDGLVVEEVKQDPLVDLSSLAAEMSVALRGLSDSTDSGGMGTLENVRLGTSEGIVLVSRVGTDYFLALILKAGGNSGRGRFYLQLEANRLVTEL